MQPFPAVDPIPLPAPVWLFKSLHLLTLTLHFFAVHFFLGGLIIGTVWAFMARARRDSVMVNASGVVAHRLPIVLAFVINLGIPPLLFTQVLYGRALYTSSVLMGVFWFGVIFLLMAVYYLSYAMARRAERGQAWALIGLPAMALAFFIAYIYSSNMTLMLRPTVWSDMYRNNPHGFQLPAGDPTIWPRWTYMMVTSLAVTGLGLSLLGMKRDLSVEVGRFLRSWGGRLLAVFTLVQAGAAYWAFTAQPAPIRSDLMASGTYRGVAMAWLATAAVVVVLGVLVSVTASRRAWALPVLAALGSFLNVFSYVVFRDGVRDAALRLAGFNVWDRTVVANWPVISLFVATLLVGVGFLGWMVWVMATAKGANERYA